MRLCRLLLILSVLVFLTFVAWLVSLWPWLLIGILGLAVYRRRQWWSGAFGTARWADASDLKDMIDAKEGVILGRIDSPPPPKLAGVLALFSPRLGAAEAVKRFIDGMYQLKANGLVRLSKAVHTAVFAPTGAGKGVSLVIPHLLTCEDSCVVIDFKGELARETAEHRRRMGHRIVLIDPFRVVTQEPDSFNPLDWIEGEHALDECRDLAEMLVVRTGEEKDPHWNDNAELWIAAMTGLVLVHGDTDRSLQQVKSILSDPTRIANAIRLMSESPEWDGMLARLAGQLSHAKDKELASTLTTTNRHLRFLDTPAIAGCTRQSTFDPSELVTGKLTCYLILPPQHMRAQGALLRMLVGSLLRTVVKAGLSNRKVQFILDEAASLGHMEQIGDALDKYRAYGVRLLLIYQSIGQLKKCWPEGADQTLLSNVTQVFFAVNENATAEYVSTRLGEYTLAVTSGGTSYGGSTQTASDKPGTSYGTSWNTSENWNQVARRLLKPEEVIALDPRIAITLTPGLPPIWTRLIRYFEERLITAPSRWTGVKTVARTAYVVFLSSLLATLVTAGLAKRTPADPYQLQPWRK